MVHYNLIRTSLLQNPIRLSPLTINYFFPAGKPKRIVPHHLHLSRQNSQHILLSPIK